MKKVECLSMLNISPDSNKQKKHKWDIITVIKYIYFNKKIYIFKTRKRELPFTKKSTYTKNT